MRTLALLLWMLAAPLWSACTAPYCSIDANGTPATATVNAGNPITQTTDLYTVIRVDGGNYSSATSTVPLSVMGFGIQYIGGGSWFMTSLDTPVSGGYGTCNVNLSPVTSTDFAHVIKRDATNLIESYWLIDTQTGTQIGTTCSYPLSARASTAALKAAGITMRQTTSTGKIAYVRVCAGTITTASAPPVGIPSACTIGDWEFGPSPGTPNDTSGQAQNLSGVLVYSDTPAYNPACTFVPQSIRLGLLMTLAPACIPLDGGTVINYTWSYAGTGLDGVTQAACALNACFSATNVAAPVITGLTRGSFNANLIVTDSTAHSANYTIPNGVVNTNSNGVVDYSYLTGYSIVSKLVGPLCHWTDPTCAVWPWYDNRHMALADAQIANLGSGAPYGPWWRDFGTLPQNSGTITLTGGNAVVAGAGTTFSAAVASGTTPKSGAVIVWRYTGTDSRTHYTVRAILSIASDTSLTMGQGSAIPYPLFASTWGALPNCNAGCAGLSFSLHWDGVDGSTYGTWAYSSAPANYYDNVIAFYTLWLRSGIDTYLFWARTLADEFWECPEVDQGTSYDAVTANYGAGFPGPFRSLSLLGIVVRMEEGALQSTMLPGLRIIWHTSAYYATTYYVAAGLISDLREEAYTGAQLAYCGLVETNATYAFSFPNTGTPANEQKDCRDALVTYSTGVWTAFKTGVGAAEGWDTFNSYPGAVTTSVFNNYLSLSGAGTVAVVNTGATVTGTGTNFDCATINGGLGHWLFYTWRVQGGHTAQEVPGDAYIRGGGGDNTYYEVTCTDATHLTVTRNHIGAVSTYQGPTASANGFALAPDPASGLSNTFLGWGQQAYSQGIAGVFFELAALALDGYNNMVRDIYYGYSDRSITWLMNYATDTTTGGGGMYIGIDYPCGSPIAAADVMCGNPTYTPDQRRQLSAEVVRSGGMNYARTGTGSIKTAMDTLMSQMFSKPGTGGLAPVDAYYLNNLDPGGTATSGTPPTGTAPKWTGQDFGFPESGSTWPGQRLGPPGPVGTQPRVQSTVRRSAVGRN